MPDRPHVRRRHCSMCPAIICTTSQREPFVCASCRRKMGLSGQGKFGENYSSMAALPAPRFSIGKCSCGCGRVVPLVNGRCEDSRFYGIAEVNADKSAAARKTRDRGRYDWVKKRNES